jgi:YVTN family beta-propeller protein
MKRPFIRCLASVLAGCVLALWAGAAHAAGPFAYIPNFGGNTVSVIDIATNTVVATIPISPATRPLSVAVNPAGTYVWVGTLNPPDCSGGGGYPCEDGSGSVLKIDATTNAMVNGAGTSGPPGGIAVNPAGTFAYVSVAGTAGYDDMGFIHTTPPMLDAIQTSTLATTHISFPGGAGVAFNPAGTFAYVAAGDVYVVDTTTKTVVTGPGLPIPAGGAYGIAMSPSGFAYVSNPSHNTVSVINTATNTISATIPVGASPYGVAINPAGTFAYVANLNDNTVSVINTTTNTVVGSPIKVGTHPWGISVSPGGNLIYVANWGDNTVSVIAETTRATVGVDIPVGAAPIAFGQFIVPGPAAVALPTRFGVYIGPTPTVGIAFNVVIQAQDATSAPQNVALATNVTLSHTTGTGGLSGTLSCTIPAGSNSCSLASVVYSVAEGGVTLTATRTAGDVIPPGPSAPTTIWPVAPKLAVTSINSGTSPTIGIAFDVVVQAQGADGTPTTVPNATNVALTVAAGSGTLGGGPPSCTIAVATTSCTVTGIIYSKAEAVVKVTATQTTGTLALSAGTSAPFTVNQLASPPQRLVVTSVNGGADPTVGVAFNVVIQAQDATGAPWNVPAPGVGVQLMLKAGTGLLVVPVSCAISTGTNSCTIVGVTYSVAESGVMINASPTIYEALGAGDSAPFTVDPVPAPATVLQLSPSTALFYPVPGVPFGLSARTGAVVNYNFQPVNVLSSTLVTLSLHSGSGILGGTLTCTIPAGSSHCIFPGVTYSSPTQPLPESGVSVTATASIGDALPPYNMGPFTVYPDAVATQLHIVVPSYPTPTVGIPFFPMIVATDNSSSSGVPHNVIVDTVVALSIQTGSGVLGGTVGCTIPAGTNSCFIQGSGVIYNKAESGVVIAATRTSGDPLAVGYSSPVTFISNPPPTKLAFIDLGSTTIAGFPFNLLVETQDATPGETSLATFATGVTLSLNSGTGTLGGVLTCTIPARGNSCFISGVTYSQAEAGVVITATRTSGPPLTPGNTSPFTVGAAPPMPPTKLVVTTVNAGASPTAGIPFNVVVQAQDGNGTPQSDYADTTVSLSLHSGTGFLGGTPGCTISANSNSCTIAGVTYSVGESGVSLTATLTSGDLLAAGTSATFTVDAAPQPPAKLAITSVNGSTSPTAGLGFNVIVQAQDGASAVQYVLASTVVSLSRNAGTGTLGGPNLTCMMAAGSNTCTVVGATYSLAEAVVSLTATRISGDPLTAGNSAPFTVVAGAAQPPTKLAITSVNGGTGPTAGAGFNVVVQAQDGTSTAQNVGSSTVVALTLNFGTGVLGGATGCTIALGASSCTVVGATYSKAEPGVILTATRTGGDLLTAGNSAPFTVNAATPPSPTKLAITSVNGGANPTLAVAFNVVVQAQDATSTAQNVIASTVVALTLNFGTGVLGGTTGCTIALGSSSCTVVGATYTKAEPGVILAATRTSGDPLTAGNSTPFTVNAATPTTTYTAASATGTGEITAAFSGSGVGCTYTLSRYIPLTGDPSSPPAGSAPAGVGFPEGLFLFTTSGCTSGSALALTITYPEPLPAGTQYWKFGPTSDRATPHWYTLPTAVVNGNTITFSITDGGLGDDDLDATNGIIVDQGGPGVPSTQAPEPIPTLSESMLALFGLALLGFGIHRVSRTG